MFSPCDSLCRHYWTWQKGSARQNLVACPSAKLNSCRRTDTTVKSSAPVWTKPIVLSACATLRTASCLGFCHAATSSTENVSTNGWRYFFCRSLPQSPKYTAHLFDQLRTKRGAVPLLGCESWVWMLPNFLGCLGESCPFVWGENFSSLVESFASLFSQSWLVWKFWWNLKTKKTKFKFKKTLANFCSSWVNFVDECFSVFLQTNRTCPICRADASEGVSQPDWKAVSKTSEDDKEKNRSRKTYMSRTSWHKLVLELYLRLTVRFVNY